MKNAAKYGCINRLDKSWTTPVPFTCKDCGQEQKFVLRPRLVGGVGMLWLIGDQHDPMATERNSRSSSMLRRFKNPGDRGRAPPVDGRERAGSAGQYGTRY